jgi:hypothetical protein
LLLRSEEFDNAYWAKFNTTITANDEVAPDGETTADTIIGENATSGTHGIDSGNTTVTSGVYVMSWFVKKSNMSWCYLRQGSGSGGTNLSRAWFNLDTGEKGGTTGSPLDSEIKPFPNGWFRISMTVNIVGTIVRPQLYIATDDLVDGFTSDGTEELIAWGAQAEPASTASSYIKTEASTVTRVADVVSKTGISSLIGQTEGTIYAEVDLSNLEDGDRIIAISDESNDNKVAIRLVIVSGTPRIRAFVIDAGSTTALITSGTITEGVFKIAVGYANDNFALYVNGTQIDEDLDCAMPACSAAYLGTREDNSGTLIFNNHIKAASLLPTRLSNAQLEALTS